MARREYESPAVAGAARRMIRALVRRAEAGDTEALEGLRSLEREVPQFVTEGMAALHAFGYSWSEVGAVAGVSRQAARQRVEAAVDDITNRGRGRVDLERVVDEWRAGLEPAADAAPAGVVALEQADRVRDRGEVLRDARDLADAQHGDPDTLGPCGCVDYHMSDCPTRTGYADSMAAVDLYDDDAYMRDLP